MKKNILIIFLVSILCITLVYAALQATLSPGKTIAKSKYSATVSFTNSGVPLSALPVGICNMCKEIGGSNYSCDTGIDNYNPQGVLIALSSKLTDSNGKVNVNFRFNGLDDSTIGTYHFTIGNAYANGTCRSGARVSGDFIVQ